MNEQTENTPQGEILIYQNGENETRLVVHLEDETVWLSQQMADLFQTTLHNITLHINNFMKREN